MPDKLDANEQRQLLGELQALHRMLDTGQSDNTASAQANTGEAAGAATSAPAGAAASAYAGPFAAIEPPLLNDVVTGEQPTPAIAMLPGSATPTDSAMSEPPESDLQAADTPSAGDALELQFGLDDPDWNQFVDQVFAEHQDLAADSNGLRKPESSSARDREQSRDAMLLDELTRKLDARLAKLRQTLLIEIKDMLQRRGRMR